MAYISLYRKWRPQTFAEVVGQEHIVQTLTNALETGRVAHAYLFSGPRGTGKTSFARLLAKGLNCVQGPTGMPCNECDNCARITRGMAVDVIEIDGASNRGIDEIRELRDRVKYAPTEGRYKVYIIDEVHMLTNEAFNALLKVLEEPPEHVIFVFATTESHKVPATILSRCQKFDFRRFSTAQLLHQLQKVSQSEGVDAEPQALALIARHAEGGMRDALAILDQCVAANGQELDVSGVTGVLGVVRREALAELAQLMLDRDLAGGLQLIHTLFAEGVEARQLLKDLSAYVRDLVLLKAAPTVPNIVTADGAYLQMMQEQVQSAHLEQLLFVVDTLAEAETEIRWSTNPALAVELMLIGATAPVDVNKTSSTSDQSMIKGLEQRIARLEEMLKRGALQPDTKAVAPSKSSVGNATPERIQVVPPEPKYEPNVVDKEVASSSTPAKAKHKQADEPASVVGSASEVDLLQAVKVAWPTLLATLKEERHITLEAFLHVGTPGQVRGKTVVIYFMPQHKFHQANVDDAKHKSIIEQMLKRLVGKDISIATATGTPPEQKLADDNAAVAAESTSASAVQSAAESGSDRNPKAQGGQAEGTDEPPVKPVSDDALEAVVAAENSIGQQDIRQSPSVQKALHLFGGKITDVQQN